MPSHNEQMNRLLRAHSRRRSWTLSGGAAIFHDQGVAPAPEHDEDEPVSVAGTDIDQAARGSLPRRQPANMNDVLRGHLHERRGRIAHEIQLEQHHREQQ